MDAVLIRLFLLTVEMPGRGACVPLNVSGTSVCLPEHLTPAAAVEHCSLSLTWKQLRSGWKDYGYVTGGLGNLMIVDSFEVWLCASSPHPCAAPSDPVCFTYSEADGVFVPWGLNSTLGLGHTMPSVVAGRRRSLLSSKPSPEPNEWNLSMRLQTILNDSKTMTQLASHITALEQMPAASQTIIAEKVATTSQLVRDKRELYDNNVQLQAKLDQLQADAKLREDAYKAKEQQVTQLQAKLDRLEADAKLREEADKNDVDLQ